ncbi:MAG: hypothetical protein K8W52_02810 [Deltaproteobacteria bacterium]|nr:hypothetical protein [Deltaproteobacteria bacterium]
MSRRATAKRRGPAPPSAPPSAPTVSGARTASSGSRTSPPRRDPRRWIYGGLNLGFAVLYAVAVASIVASRHATDRALLWTLPLWSGVAGAGVLLGGRWGWRLACGGCLGLLAIATWLLLAIAVDAAFLAGVYGALGASAVGFALIAGLLVIELVALVPALELAWLRGRAGRRAFGVARPREAR